jgi:hypothetical protein
MVRVKRKGNRKDKFLNFSSDDSERRKRKTGINANKPRRLAPLDHIKNLYDGAAQNMSSSAEGGTQRRIYQKKDLMEAVKRVAPSSSPNKYAGDLSPVRPSTTSVSNAVPATDYAKSTFDTLEAGVHQNAKRCNELKALIESKQVKSLSKITLLNCPSVSI